MRNCRKNKQKTGSLFSCERACEEVLVIFRQKPNLQIRLIQVRTLSKTSVLNWGGALIFACISLSFSFFQFFCKLDSKIHCNFEGHIHVEYFVKILQTAEEILLNPPITSDVNCRLGITAIFLFQVNTLTEKLIFRTQRKVPKLGVMLVGWGGNNGATFTAALIANKLKLSWSTRKGTQEANWYWLFTHSLTPSTITH